MYSNLIIWTLPVAVSAQLLAFTPNKEMNQSLNTKSNSVAVSQQVECQQLAQSNFKNLNREEKQQSIVCDQKEAQLNWQKTYGALNMQDYTQAVVYEPL